MGVNLTLVFLGSFGPFWRYRVHLAGHNPYIEPQPLLALIQDLIYIYIIFLYDRYAYYLSYAAYALISYVAFVGAILF